MCKAVFLDTDVILDVALARPPFLTESKKVLTMAHLGYVKAYTSSICIANIHYIARKKAGETGSRSFLSRLLSFITVLPVDHQLTLEALASRFTDFEDAMQHEAAVWNHSDCIITRNIGDYHEAILPVYTPTGFLRLYGTEKDL